jgi:hypothetical protein
LSPFPEPYRFESGFDSTSETLTKCAAELAESVWTPAHEITHDGGPALSRTLVSMVIKLFRNLI